MHGIATSVSDSWQSLVKIAVAIQNRLQHHAGWQPDVYFDEPKARLYFSSHQLPYLFVGTCADESMAEVIPQSIRRIVFHGCCPMASYLNDIVGSIWQMGYRRSIVEIAKKIPSWRAKNRLYRHIGVNADQTGIVAPNVLVDYIYPELIEYGTNSIIGEESMLLTHLLYPDRMEIGPINIGRNCLIGTRAIILPGVTIGDGATVGAHTIVTRDVPPGATLLGPKSGLQLLG